MMQKKEIPPFYAFEPLELDGYVTKLVQDMGTFEPGKDIGTAAPSQVDTRIAGEMERLLLALTEAPINKPEGGPRLFIQGGKRHINLRKAVRSFFEVCTEQVIAGIASGGALLRQPEGSARIAPSLFLPGGLSCSIRAFRL